MKKTTREKVIHVPCPLCKNTRLFDSKESAVGIIQIKCPQCKEIVTIDLEKVNLKIRDKKYKGYQKVKAELRYRN